MTSAKVLLGIRNFGFSRHRFRADPVIPGSQRRVQRAERSERGIHG